LRELAGRCAILTGASRGIGIHLATSLADRGLNLVLAARSVDGLNATRAAAEPAVRRFRTRIVTVPTDVTSGEALMVLVARAEAEFGAIDLLINNAGVETFAEYHLLSPQIIDETLDVNLRAPMLLTRLVLPGMLRRRRGHIVNMASLSGKLGLACMETYVATKAGLIAFTQSLRASYRARGVSGSAICPSFVADGGMFQRFIEDREAAGLPTDTRQARPVPTAKVVAAVLRAIADDLPEVIVAPRPMRPLLAAATLAPAIAERATERLGLNDLTRNVGIEHSSGIRTDLNLVPRQRGRADGD
jgi:short-subunit dehydrogenase